MGYASKAFMFCEYFFFDRLMVEYFILLWFLNWFKMILTECGFDNIYYD